MLRTIATILAGSLFIVNQVTSSPSISNGAKQQPVFTVKSWTSVAFVKRRMLAQTSWVAFSVGDMSMGFCCRGSRCREFRCRRSCSFESRRSAWNSNTYIQDRKAGSFVEMHAATVISNCETQHKAKVSQRQAVQN